jgi:hypothetical protein
MGAGPQQYTVAPVGAHVSNSVPEEGKTVLIIRSNPDAGRVHRSKVTFRGWSRRFCGSGVWRITRIPVELSRGVESSQRAD